MTGMRSKLTSLIALLSGCITASAKSSSSSAVWPVQSFRSSALQPPFLNVTKMGQTEPGFLFLGPSDSVRDTSSPMIYSDDGQLVWHGPNINVSAVQPQTLHGEPVLAYWQGYNTHKGFGFGSIVIRNSSYDQLYEVTLSQEQGNFFTSYGPMDSYIDIHESQITDEGTILVTVVNTTRADMSSVGGPKDGWVQDGLFYEIDIKTNKIVFSWSALDHLSEIPMTNVEVPLDGKGKDASDPFSYAHLNSVAKYGDNYLISSRYMCSIFLLNKTGNVIWHLHGQEGGDFDLGVGTTFCYQHDARFLSQSANKTTMSLHNNENCDFISGTTATTGLVLDLDFESHKVTLNRRMWNAANPVYSESQGSYQTLDNDHVLLFHGRDPVVEEYDENGACVMTARYGFEGDMQGYRGYRKDWVGRPRTKPSVVACAGNGGGGAGKKVSVYVSWNGASDVQRWRVYMGDGSDMKDVKVVAKNGFETRIDVDGGSGKMVQVEAVGGVNDGTRSEAVSVGSWC